MPRHLPESSLNYLRATQAFIDLDAIDANVRALRATVPAQTQIMAVVKADGYGHGAPWVARAALEAGATSLGVATVSEGHVLRLHGIEASIVLLGSIVPAEAANACHAQLEIAVADEALLDAVQDATRSIKHGSPTAVHLKIDSGLRRYGALPSQALSLAKRIEADPWLRFAGIFTHFASADEPDEAFTIDQLRCFEATATAIREAGITVPPRHAANSAGILTRRGIDYDVVRAGIAIYGVPPSADVPLLPAMRPAFRLESRVARVIPISRGDTVGYNRTFRAQRSMQGALIPVGYADGYRRSLSGRAWVGVAGKPASILGRVSMDQVVVEVPDGATVVVGDRVHLLGGEAASGAPSIGDMANLIDTNAYEVLVGIRKRVPRVFTKDGQVIAIRVEGDELNSEAMAGSIERG